MFLVPVVLLLPLKLLGLWMLAQRLRGSARSRCLAFAKVVSLGVTAFIFDVTRPKLLQLAWFRWLYEHVLAWLAWAHALVDPIKERMQARMQHVRAAARRPHGAGCCGASAASCAAQAAA